MTDDIGETANAVDYMEKMFAILDDFNLDIALYEAEIDSQGFVTGWGKRNKEDLSIEDCN